LRGRDIKRYQAEFADLWLIDSHNGYVNSIGVRIPPVNITHFPAVKHWLDSHWDRISSRGDKGKTPYNLRDCAYYEEFEKEKIVYKDISQVLTFALSKPGEYFNNTVYFIAQNQYLKYLLAILNSKIINWYFGQISTQLGSQTTRGFSIHVYRLPIPKLDANDMRPFVDIVITILNQMDRGDFGKQTTHTNTINNCEKEIDNLVYRHFELTSQEIELIESYSTSVKNHLAK